MKEKNEEGALDLLRSEKGLLHEACFQQNLEAVEVLLELGVSCAEWNKVGLFSASSSAVICNAFSACCYCLLLPCLLSLSLSLSLSFTFYQAFILPLHIAAKNNSQSIARKLLDHDCDGVDRPSKFGETPLHFACMQGHFDMVKLLTGLVLLHLWI